MACTTYAFKVNQTQLLARPSFLAISHFKYVVDTTH